MPDDPRIEAAASADLFAEFEGRVTFELVRRKYGDKEAENEMNHRRRIAQRFLAMYDAVRAIEKLQEATDK